MNCTVEYDKAIKIPKANINKEAEEYQPVMPFDFRIDTDFNTEQKKEDKMKEGKLLLWKWHVRLHHLPFKRMKMLAKQGRIPRKLAKTEIPFCPTCTYSKATRNLWRVKGISKPLKEIEYPRKCVSTDSFESATAGFAMQLKGVLTNK